MSRRGLLFTGKSLEPETITFKNRVIADGGEIIDLKYINSEVRRLKSITDSGTSMWNRLSLYCSPAFAIKRNTSDATKVEKIYDLKRSLMDLIQTTSTYQGTFTTGQNGKPCVQLDDTDDYYQTNYDAAMVQPLSIYYNLFPQNGAGTDAYWYDGQTNFDYCAMSGPAAFRIFAGTGLLPSPAPPSGVFIKTRAVFNGTSSKIKINGSETLGNAGTRPINGLTIGKPGGTYPTNTSFNAGQKFHDAIILSGIATSGEDSSTEILFNSRY